MFPCSLAGDSVSSCSEVRAEPNGFLAFYGRQIASLAPSVTWLCFAKMDSVTEVLFDPSLNVHLYSPQMVARKKKNTNLKNSRQHTNLYQ